MCIQLFIRVGLNKYLYRSKSIEVKWTPCLCNLDFYLNAHEELNTRTQSTIIEQKTKPTKSALLTTYMSFNNAVMR